MGVIVPSPPGGKPIDSGVVTTATLQNAATGDGNGTDFDITGMATTVLLVAPISYTGTVTFWASMNGVTFIKIKGNQQDTTTIADNVANPGSTASLWTFQTAGLTKIRAVMSSSGGTSCTVTGAASPRSNSVPLGVTLSSAVLAAGTALIGTIQISDGTTSSQKLAVDSAGNASVNLGKVGGTAVALGQTTMSAGVPVALASDQSAVPVSTSADITCYASAARTASPSNMADQTNNGAKGLLVVVDATVNAGGSGSITVTIQGKDVASGKYYTILASAAIVTVTTNQYTVYPTLTASANSIAQAALPHTWRVIVTANNANPVTYSVGASYLS